ncbi:MAG: aldehyde dehydrogenase family protein [Polyangiaceae bacterium]|nr:aldehyde dehydrogenase family protein [Polyangiaceae bacterium]
MSQEVTQALAQARAAQPAFAELPLSARVRALRPLASRILSRADEIAEVLHEETGKPRVEARLAEVLPNADLVAYWLDEAPRVFEPEEVPLDLLSYPSKGAVVERVARGVVALVTPWNFPVAIPLRTLVPALLAGNAVVFKPSEITPRAGALVASLFDGLLPHGVLSLVQGGGDVGAALVGGDVDLVVFTGSVRTGKRIAVTCAERLVACSLELGGKDAAIVLADADVERAAHGVAWGALTNAGQNCASIERVYVESAVADAFTRRVGEIVAGLRFGVDFGPLTTDAQATLVRAHLDEARASGAEIVAEATLPADAGPRAVAPTVVKITDEATPLMQDETFGPVLPIVVVKSAGEAIERANACRFGLTGSIWSKHLGKAEQLARRLRVGVVTINNHGFTAAVPALPWTGTGETGTGITNSPHALAELTRPRVVLTDANRARRELWWYPYTPALDAVARAMAKARGGAGLVGRVAALFSLVGAFVRRLSGG